MIHLLRLACLLALATWASAAAPFQGEREAPDFSIEMRVLSVVSVGDEPTARVDRGASSGLEPGDRIVFSPLGRSPIEGTVLRVDDRECTVEIPLRAGEVAPGTPCKASIPSSRFRSTDTPRAENEPASGRPPIRWSSDELGWDGATPLLSTARPRSRAERDSKWKGRAYLTADLIRDRQDAGREDTFTRIGFDARGTNLFGRGGTLRFDGEFNARSTDVADGQGESESLARLDRLFYSLGGTREEARHIAFGRFLPSQFPELGLLDGVEVSWRAPAGHRYGASLGYLPSQDRDRTTGDTLQVSTWATALVDADERLEIGGALQKTWHEGQSDRDLLLARLRWSPGGPWSAYATGWVDLYGSDDTAKDSSMELTQLLASVTRRIGPGAGASLSASLVRYPALLRGGLQQLPLEILSDGETRRVTVSGWTRLGAVQRLRVRVDRWTDQESSGGGGEVGWERRLRSGMLDRIDLSGFLSEGRFSDVMGIRAGTGGPLAGGRWRTNLDLGRYSQRGFSGDQEELIQSALNLGWDGALGRDWFLSLTTTYRFGDEQDALSLAFLLQRRF